MRNMLPCQSRCIHPLSDGYSENRRVTERKKTHFAGGNVSGLAGVIEPTAHRLFYLKLFTSSFLTNLPLSCLQKAGSYVCEVHLHTFRFSLSFSVHQLCVCVGGRGGGGADITEQLYSCSCLFIFTWSCLFDKPQFDAH